MANGFYFDVKIYNKVTDITLQIVNTLLLQYSKEQSHECSLRGHDKSSLFRIIEDDFRRQNYDQIRAMRNLIRKISLN